jgi:hypothetical protein
MAAHRGLLRSLGEIDDPDGEISTIYCFASAHLRASLARRGEGEGALEEPLTVPGPAG